MSAITLLVVVGLVLLAFGLAAIRQGHRAGDHTRLQEGIVLCILAILVLCAPWFVTGSHLS